MYILETVKLGSIITRSPDCNVIMRALGSFASYCSAIKGEILDLKPPVPTPNITRPIAKIAIAAFGCTIRGGILAIRMNKCPMIAIRMDHRMVL